MPECPKCKMGEDRDRGGFVCGSFFDGSDASMPFVQGEACKTICSLRRAAYWLYHRTPEADVPEWMKGILEGAHD